MNDANINEVLSGVLTICQVSAFRKIYGLLVKTLIFEYFTQVFLEVQNLH